MCLFASRGVPEGIMIEKAKRSGEKTGVYFVLLGTESLISIRAASLDDKGYYLIDGYTKSLCIWTWLVMFLLSRARAD